MKEPGSDTHQIFEAGWNQRRSGLARRLSRAETPAAGGSPGVGSGAGRSDPVRRICAEVKERVLAELESSHATGLVSGDEDAIRKQIRRLLNEELESRRLGGFRDRDRRELEKTLMDEMTGAGLLQPLLDDPTLSDILVNGPDEIWVDRYGRLEKTGIRFDNARHLMQILSRMVEKHGRHLEESNPCVDARLSDGSRLHAVIPPISEIGPVVSIRRARTVPLTLRDITSSGSLTPEMAEFIAIAIKRRLNLLFTGGASTGKTSLLNIFSRFIPHSERVVTIEETRELLLDHPHTIGLETRSANTEGLGEIDLRVLVRNALRMRADRIIVGEVRGSEVFEMLQAMNVGHEGSLSTLHANSPGDALRRLESLVQLSGFDLPSTSVREMIGSTIDLIVQLERFPDGSRRVVDISQVGSEDEDGDGNGDGSRGNRIHRLFGYTPEEGFRADPPGPALSKRLKLSAEEIGRLFNHPSEAADR